MKYSKREISNREHTKIQRKNEDQRLTSFAEMIVFQPLLSGLCIKERLRSCFNHLFNAVLHRASLIRIISLAG